jgi:hypothetical protein
MKFMKPMHKGLIMWSLVLVRKLETTTQRSLEDVTILKRAWYANLKKLVWYVLLRPLRPELDGQDQVQIIVTRALNCSH